MAESLGEATQSVLPVMEVEVRYRTRHGNGKTLSVSTRRNTWWNEKRRKGDEGQLKRGRKRNSDRGWEGRDCANINLQVDSALFVHPSELI